MGWNEDTNRRKILRRLLQLWNMVPDNTFAELISDVFSMKAMALDGKTDEEMYGRINDLISGKEEMIYKTKLHRKPPMEADGIMAWRSFTSDDYAKARAFLGEIKGHVDILTRQEYATIKGRALHGDLEGAKRGLKTIIEQKKNAGCGR